ncbi:hypothetical protein, partial [Streptomyces beihaiensis]
PAVRPTATTAAVQRHDAVDVTAAVAHAASAGGTNRRSAGPSSSGRGPASLGLGPGSSSPLHGTGSAPPGG